MSSTPNLLISHIAASQNQKEVTANSALDSLDEAMNDSVSLAISGTTTTVSQANALANIFFIFTGALTDTNTITLPANKRIYVVLNNTAGGQKLIFKAGTGAATVTVQGTGPYLLYCDGSNTVYTLSIAAIKIQNYTVVGLPGAPSEGQLAYATDGLKSSEIAGGGTGVPVYFSNGSWRTFYDDNPVSA